VNRQRPARPRVDPDPVVLAKIRDKIAAANVVATFAHHRELSDRFAPLFDLILNQGMTPRRQRELVILRTGWNCGSEYEFGQHTLFGRDAGLTDAEIRALVRPLDDHAWSADDRVLLEMADDLHADSYVGDATWAGLTARWRPAEILEFLAACLCYVAVSGILNTFGVELDKGVPGWPSSEVTR
jgi:alkylhydroperoxidase family enzyme